jgi:2-C-methyl-D-erythritol 4-phosphate cytidylyltransferase/2-C-methyl-D-erythritol 2,4-cyclodiphosphate synthase
MTGFCRHGLQNPDHSFPQTIMPDTTMHTLWGIVLAAGQGSRLHKAGVTEKKQFLTYRSLPLFWHSVITLARVPTLRGVVLVFPEEDLQQARNTVHDLIRAEDPGIEVLCTTGGERRQDSVFQGLTALPARCDLVLVHDAARPFLTPALVSRLLQGLTDDTRGVIPGIPVTDTVKLVDNDGGVEHTPDRSRLAAVQTPQLFPVSVLRKAHETAIRKEWNVTDDAALLEQLSLRVRVVRGEESNIKITTPEDLFLLKESQVRVPVPCTGFGYDVHKYGGPRPMVLGGIPIAGGPGIFAHSDGDVLLHALIDGLLGCLGKGDIGDHFPDSDNAYEGMASGILLDRVMELVRQSSMTLTHIDLTLIAQIPRLGPHKQAIAKNVARLLELPSERVNVKATTEEGLGFTGTRQGIKAVAVVSATRPENDS